MVWLEIRQTPTASLFFTILKQPQPALHLFGVKRSVGLLEDNPILNRVQIYAMHPYFVNCDAGGGGGLLLAALKSYP
jgi:hypothetical protein